MPLLRPTAIGLAAALALAIGCGQSENKAAPAKPAAKEVVWPQLRALDEVAHRIDAILQSDEAEKLKATAAEVKAKAKELLENAQPQDVADKLKVEQLKKDLADLVKALENEAQESEMVKATLEASRDVVEELMRAAGVPHKHDHDHDHGDHAGHSH
jgi:predicted RNase H-like nuclease (RuvC/YqgF family)